MSKDSHEIIHIDTAIRIARAAPPAAAQPEQEPVACLNKTQAKAILDLALDLEKTGRMVVLTEGQERSDFAARNRNIQCALEDALRNATTPPAAQPAVPDAIHHTDLSETLEYIQGWNDCRAEMLGGKP